MDREIKFRFTCVKPAIIFHADFTIDEIVNRYAEVWMERNITQAGVVHKRQYTGFKDKTGKEIYESDIVEVDNSEPKENGEYDVTTVCKWENGCFILEDMAGGHWTRQLFHQQHRLKIIGNVHENPELVKLIN